jgi:hypothetical protein
MDMNEEDLMILCDWYVMGFDISTLVILFDL